MFVLITDHLFIVSFMTAFPPYLSPRANRCVLVTHGEIGHLNIAPKHKPKKQASGLRPEQLVGQLFQIHGQADLAACMVLSGASAVAGNTLVEGQSGEFFDDASFCDLSAGLIVQKFVWARSRT
jgi:hypothetical protein